MIQSIFDEYFHWHTSSWFQNHKQYLKEKIGSYPIMMESTPLSRSDNHSVSMFGLSMTTKREYVDFTKILSQDFQSSNRVYYLNIQPEDSGESPYRPPLHLLQEDLSAPHSQKHVSEEDSYNLLDVIWSNLTAINLWMGKVPSSRLSTQSRLHRDATDNLYLLYEGKKTFHLWNPSTAFALQTISPVIGINEEGLSYLWNTLRFRDFLRYELHRNNQTLREYFTSQQLSSLSASSETQQSQQQQQQQRQQQALELLATLLSDNVPYDLENIHFSTCQSPSPSTPPTSPSHCRIPPPEVTIELSPGDLFYLPTGFFHEVISSTGDHSALNLWWKPLQWEQAVPIEHEISHELFQKVLYAFTQ